MEKTTSKKQETEVTSSPDADFNDTFETRGDIFKRFVKKHRMSIGALLLFAAGETYLYQYNAMPEGVYSKCTGPQTNFERWIDANIDIAKALYKGPSSGC